MTLTHGIAAALASATLALGAALVAAPVSTASTNTFVATPHGMVGVQQEVVIRAPRLAGQVATITFASGATSNAGQTAVDAQGFGALAWTPTTAGSWTISAFGSGSAIGSTTISVAQMPTTTAALVPNLVQTGVANLLTIVVSAPIGVLSPSGTVTLRNQFENQLATGNLEASSNNTSSVTVSWTPVGNEAVTAFYTPPPGGGFMSSQSGQYEPVYTTAQVPIALRFPGTLYVGTPTIIGAQAGNGVAAGSAAFFFDGIGIIGSTPTDAKGGVSPAWSPPTSGVHTISTQFSSNNGRFAGTSSQLVNIQPAKSADSIAVIPAGGTPWPTGTPIPVRAGTSVNLAVTTGSGATGLLSKFGPCVINESTFTALSAGQCTVTAMSPGTANSTPGTADYVVTVQSPPERSRRLAHFSQQSGG